MKSLTNKAIWQALKKHQHELSQKSIKELFEDDKNRYNKYSKRLDNFVVDYSKNHVNHDTLKLLIQLAEDQNLQDKIKDMFSGKKINITENRAALHTALRAPKEYSLILDNVNIISKIHDQLEKMQHFCRDIYSGTWLGFSNKKISDVVNIGIGGSDLGPQMATESLTPFHQSHVNCHFVSNLDASHIIETLKNLNPETTLFILSSKSFSTAETLCNFQTAKNWLLNHYKNDKSFHQHFVTVTANEDKAKSLGFTPEQIFHIWDFVGGRYSLWSAVGLPIMLAIGPENFYEFLSGAHKMDQHFQTSALHENIPVILALIGIWYNNFFEAKSVAVLPYNHYLRRFTAYLQQADMESNGKQMNIHGEKVDYHTGAILWGDLGTNSQHAFHQLLHQGTHYIPTDFIVAAQSTYNHIEHHSNLFANCLSQAQALMIGRNEDEAYQELLKKGYDENHAKSLAKHLIIPGNRPSTLITFDKLTPYNLGMLIALYEHKIFAQGVIWEINSYDQWGVELGKQLSQKILPSLQDKNSSLNYDASTNGLIEFYREFLEI